MTLVTVSLSGALAAVAGLTTIETEASSLSEALDGRSHEDEVSLIPAVSGG